MSGFPLSGWGHPEGWEGRLPAFPNYTFHASPYVWVTAIQMCPDKATGDSDRFKHSQLTSELPRDNKKKKKENKRDFTVFKNFYCFSCVVIFGVYLSSLVKGTEMDFWERKNTVPAL